MPFENSDTYRRIEAELLPGEELLWAGQPKARHMLLGRSTGGNKAALLATIVGLQLFLVLGALFFVTSSSTTTSTTTGTTTTTQGTPWVIIAGVVVAMLVGLLAMSIPLFQYWKSKKTIYAITDRRALTITGDVVRSYGERDIEFIERRMHRDGTGDIIFRREAHTGTAYYGSSVFAPQTRIANVGFFGISDPHEVEELMLDVFRPDAYPRKRKHDEEYWDDGANSAGDTTFEEEMEGLKRKAS